MDRFVIEGGFPLRGEVVPSGNKNETLPLLAASLLTDERIVLRNVPHIRDVRTMLSLLSDLGVDVEELGPHEVVLQARRIARSDLNPTLCGEIRASILLAGPMLARCGRVELPPPGGDVIGRRRVDTHLSALRALGAEVELDGGYKMGTSGLRGRDIFLDEASVTGTENAITAACRAQGTTIIRNAACEPHVQNLCHFLNKLGARIEGIGTNTLTIHGVEQLGGGEWEIGSDFVEVGSFIGLAVATGSELLIKKAVPEHLRMTRLMLGRLGVHVEVRGEDVLVPGHQHLRVISDVGGAVPKIDDGIWPAFPTDLMSVAVVVATQAAGTILIHEKMYEGRLYFVDKLISMGARIILCDPYRAVVVGPAQLRSAQLESPDIRAGIALVIAALCAQGRSVIGNIGQIDRGYERIEEKLQALGARIERTRE
ncbi:MAG: UDP-N-acetylglucosamine 1-carboxyvinyltransferase [Chloroflexota bacterium]|nr:UDP-N-acetylglucosamine 1-carboxyvinyltransferase [Chloroflexota bacterium]